jgi:hypothetical protein
MMKWYYIWAYDRPSRTWVQMDTAEGRNKKQAIREYRRSRGDVPSAARLQARPYPSRQNKAKKKASTTKRLSAALTRFLKKSNPAKMRGVSHVRVKKLKTGGVTITPVRGNGKVISGYGSTTMNPRRRRKR